MLIKFNELTDKEFYEILEQNTDITKYFKKKVLKCFKKHLEETYPNGLELDYFIETCPSGKEFYELFGYLGEK